MSPGYRDHVFVNCPFDKDYALLFDAMVFAIYKCNFLPRCAKEVDDASENRLDKIVRIIDECRLGIHDISRTELSQTGLPRFNIPLELGLFLGAKKFGDTRHRRKKCLVLDSKPYRYQEFISDIAGQDIQSHEGCPRQLVIAIRNWLNEIQPDLPGGSSIWNEYEAFRDELPELCEAADLVEAELTFADYIRLVYGWLENVENGANGRNIARRTAPAPAAILDQREIMGKNQYIEAI